MGMVLSRKIMYEPYYEVHLDGKKLDDWHKKFITNIEVEESVFEADLGRITIADPHLTFLNNTGLAKKMPIKIIMGHKMKHRLMLDGEVTHIEADFGEDGVPKLVVGAIDKTNKMTSVQKSRVWKNKKASDVIKAIAGEYGLKPKVKETVEVIEQISQDKETDAQIIAKLAEDEAFVWYIVPEKKELFWGNKFDKVVEADTLWYRDKDFSIRSFTPTFVEKNKGEVEDKSEKISAKTGKKEKSSTTKKPEAPPKKSQAGAKTKTPVKPAPSKNNKKKNTGINMTTGKVSR